MNCLHLQLCWLYWSACNWILFAGLILPRLLWNRKVHYRVHNNPSVHPILIHIIQSTPCLFKISFNIILPSIPAFHVSASCEICDWNFVCTYMCMYVSMYFSYIVRATCPAHLIPFYSSTQSVLAEQYKLLTSHYVISLCCNFNPLNAELNPIRHLLALVEARNIVHVSRIRVNRSVYCLRSEPEHIVAQKQNVRCCTSCILYMIYRQLHFEGKICFQLQGWSEATLKVEAVWTSYTLVPTYQTTRCHNIEASTYICRHEGVSRLKGQLHAPAAVPTKYEATCDWREPNCETPVVL